jgi:hypothetical protein
MSPMTEFQQFQSRGFRHRTNYFRIPADASPIANNCLFNSILTSGHVPDDDGPSLRRSVIAWMQTEGASFADDVFALLGKTTETFEQYTRSMTGSRFAGDIEMCCMSMMYGINVTSYSNITEGIFVFNTFSFISDHLPHHADSLLIKPRNVYLYHHLFKCPLTPALRPNHFCLLVNVSFPVSVQPYEGEQPTIRNVIPLCLGLELSDYIDQAGVKDPIKATTVQPFRWNIKPVAKKRAVPDPKITKQRKSKEPSKKETTSILDWCRDHTANPVERKRLGNLIEKNNCERDAQDRRREALGIGADESVAAVCLSIIQKVVDQCEPAKKTSSANIVPPVVISSRPVRPAEWNWEQRAAAIYFFHHPQMGRSDLKFAAHISQIKPQTLRSWLSNKSLKPKWLATAILLTPQLVIKIIVSKLQVHLFDGVNFLPMPHSVQDEWKASLQQATSKLSQTTMSRFCIVGEKTVSVQKMASLSKTKSEKFAFINKGTHRIALDREKGLGRRVKYVMEEAALDNYLETRWEQGNAATIEEINMKMRHMYGKGSTEFSKVVVGNPERLRKWIARAMERPPKRWSNRKLSVCQAIPENWKEVARRDAKHIRDTFIAEGVEAEIAVDETFVLFHSTSDRVVAPKGAKRIASATPVDNDKLGLTVVVAAERRSSQLLPPFVIGAGTVGGDLFREWSAYKKSVFTFNPSHWMTQETAIMFLTFLVTLFPSKTIGVIWDRARCHYGTSLNEWVSVYNQKHSHARIVIVFIEAGMTAIMQVGDLCINKPLKQHIKSAYYRFRDELFNDAEKCPKPGDKIKVPREKVLGFIEEAYDHINKSNLANRWIAHGFRICGQDPYFGDLSDFDAHLMSLEENEIYSLMIKGNKALDLSGC